MHKESFRIKSYQHGDFLIKNYQKGRFLIKKLSER